MATIKFKLVDDPTFNDFLRTIEFKYGICEFDADDKEKLRHIEDLRMIGFKLENYVGETPNPDVPAIPPPTGKKAIKALKKKEATAARAKKKRAARAAKAKAKTAVKSKPQVVKPEEQASPTIPPLGTNFDLNRKGRVPSEFTEEKVEQSKDKPESDGKGRSGDTGKDDTVSKTDS